MEFLRTTDPVSPAWSGCKTMHVTAMRVTLRKISQTNDTNHPRDSVQEYRLYRLPQCIMVAIYQGIAVEKQSRVPSLEILEEKVEKYPPLT
jgi:hypothetical protein